jgi:hypothetical protein
MDIYDGFPDLATLTGTEKVLASVPTAAGGQAESNGLVPLGALFGGLGSAQGVAVSGAPVAGATITVGAEIANARAITIQLTDGLGADLASRQAVWIAVLLDAVGDAFVVTGGSTGIAIGTDGALLAAVAKKLFLAISEADGDIDLTWTDTGTEAAYLAVILPSGGMVISDALTNA